MKSIPAWLLPVLAAALACGSGAPRVSGASVPGPMPATFQSGDARLAFTLDLPPGPGPFPAVVTAHGSGLVRRGDLARLSSQFTRLGFAVLRFDKRGVGESTGTYSGVGVTNGDAMIAQLAGDVAAGVRFLRTRPEIDGRRIGLAGASQAGWILPHAARELGDVTFMVLISGPVCSIGLEIYYSDLVEESDRPLDEGYAMLPAFKGPHGYDPVPVLQALHTPGLWLLGTDDRSIPVRDTIVNLQALAATGHPFEWRTYPGQGHSLSPAIWDDVAPWVLAHRSASPR